MNDGGHSAGTEVPGIGEAAPADDIPPLHKQSGPITRVVLLGIGWFFVATGIIGIFLPVLPTTPFLLISLWAFSKSSPRLHKWLYTHPKAGPYLVAWNRYHVIPPKAKLLAITLMASSWLYVTLVVADSWVTPTIIGITMAAMFSWILTRPSHPPQNSSPE